MLKLKGTQSLDSDQGRAGEGAGRLDGGVVLWNTAKLARRTEEREGRLAQRDT
jgi:hypothetical protein